MPDRIRARSGTVYVMDENEYDEIRERIQEARDFRMLKDAVLLLLNKLPIEWTDD